MGIKTNQKDNHDYFLESKYSSDPSKTFENAFKKFLKRWYDDYVYDDYLTPIYFKTEPTSFISYDFKLKLEKSPFKQLNNDLTKQSAD